MKKSKTGDVEVIHGVDDYAPTKSVPECKAWIRDKLSREGPTHITIISDDFKRDMDKENLVRLAYALEEMRNEGEVLVGEDGTWVLIRG